MHCSRVLFFGPHVVADFTYSFKTFKQWLVPSSDSCDTLDLTSSQLPYVEFILTLCFLDVKYINYAKIIPNSLNYLKNKESINDELANALTPDKT